MFFASIASVVVCKPHIVVMAFFIWSITLGILFQIPNVDGADDSTRPYPSPV